MSLKRLEMREEVKNADASASTAAGLRELDQRARAVRNFTDPDSHVMKDGNGYSQAFNCQAAVDEAHQVIVAARA